MAYNCEFSSISQLNIFIIFYIYSLLNDLLIILFWLYRI